MLKEAIDRLAELGSEAAGIEIKELDQRKVVVRTGTTYATVERDPPPRKYVAEQVVGFVAIVEQLATNGIVFVDSESVVAVLDDDIRSDKIVMPLTESRALTALRELATPRDQRFLITKLREELAGCVEERFLATIRRLDFSRKNDGRSSIQHGKESLGKSVEAVVQSAEGDVAEVIVVSFMAFTDIGAGSTIEVRCAVTLDAVNEKIAIRPVGEELTSGLLRARQGVCEKLGALLDGITCVVGSPGLIG